MLTAALSLPAADVENGSRRRLRLPDRMSALGPAGAVLAVLVAGGVGLRIVAVLSWWPANPTLADSWDYAYYASSNPLADPQHPAGYSSFLAVVGVFTRSVAATVILQHILGLVAAVLLYGAVRRLFGSRWAALVPAAVVLLNSDQVYLEQTVMAEGVYVFFMCAALYASVRAIERPERLWPWSIAAVVLALASALIRTQGLFYLPVLVIALWFASAAPWRQRWRVPLVVAALGVAALLAYAFANLASNDRFEVSPATGWHLYGRVAPYVQCQYFTPPKGTRVLCDPRPPSQRPGSDWYLYSPQSPAVRYFRPFGNHDATLKSFALAAIEAEPKAYLRGTFHEIEAYFVPSLHPYVYGGGCGIDCQVDWNLGLQPPPASQAPTIRGMETFYDPFTPRTSPSGLSFLRAYEHPFRFGATMLVLTSLLTLLGLSIGSRRERIGVFLFGVGGLAMLIFPTFGVYYLGRYMVPIAAPMAAAGAICVLSLARLESLRRRSGDAQGLP
jgi:4-amino-4-deoxy-L-arabinose transferase-like glycosyltransferase